MPVRWWWRAGCCSLARPSLAAGALLVAMETLTDFATVQYFDLQTVSVGIYQVWVGQYDRAAASELAGVVLLFALAVIAAERVGRGGARPSTSTAPDGRSRRTRCMVVRLRWPPMRALVLAVAFVIPVAQLLLWSRPARPWLDGRFLGYVVNTAGP